MRRLCETPGKRYTANGAIRSPEAEIQPHPADLSAAASEIHLLHG